MSRQGHSSKTFGVHLEVPGILQPYLSHKSLETKLALQQDQLSTFSERLQQLMNLADELKSSLVAKLLDQHLRQEVRVGSVPISSF